MNAFMTMGLAVLLLAGCAGGKPVPYAIERAGSLPAAAYDAMERAAAGAAPVLAGAVAAAGARPEPAWAYVFEPGFAPRDAPLRVEAFTGGGEREREVGTALAGALGAAAGPLFAPSPVSAWTDGVAEFVLSGTVMRAGEQAEGKRVLPATQVEAVLRRRGAVVGVMQANAVQPAAGEVAPLSGVHPEYGSRAVYVASLFRALLGEAATGREAAVAPGVEGGRYLRAVPPDGTGKQPG